MSSNKNQSNGAGIFIILTLVFLSISVWQTAKGYELMFGKHLSWVFSLAIGFMMLFLSFEMRKRRLRGYNTLGPLIGYIACAIFCFFGNFNAIYSRYNREELFKTELQGHKQELTAIVTKATAALESSDEATKSFEKSVLEHKGQLLLQIKDPANSGLGARARQEINVLEGLLEQKLTEFSGTPDQLAESYSNNIDHILSTKLNNTKYVQAQKLIAEIIEKQDELNPLILDALKPQNINGKAQGMIFTLVDAINTIGEETKNLLGKDKFEFKQAEFENQEIGKMSHTFASAFNGNNWASALLSILVAIAIDALVPFVIFVGTKREEDENNEDPYVENRRKSKGAGVVVIR